jgi:hypothetical protein
MTHVLERTNVKPEPFVGKCLVCGKQGLTIAQVTEPCSNPNNITSQQAFELAQKRIE